MRRRPSTGRVRALRSEHAQHVDARGGQRGPEPRQHAGNQHQQQNEPDDGPVRRELDVLRLLDRDGERADERLRPPRDHQAAAPARAGNHESFGQRPAARAATSCAPMRGANAHVALALDGAREQQIGDVETGEQQHEPDDAHRDGRGDGNPRSSLLPSPKSLNRAPRCACACPASRAPSPRPRRRSVPAPRRRSRPACMRPSMNSHRASRSCSAADVLKSASSSSGSHTSGE